MDFIRRHAATLVGCAIVLTWQFLYPLLESILPAVKNNAYLTRSGEWLAVALLLGVILFWERRPLSSIGIRRMQWRDLGWGLAGFVVGILTFILTNQVVRALRLTTVTGTINSQLGQVPVPVLLFTALTAGIAEEILYRGFLIERLAALTGNVLWGALIAYVAFLLIHVSFWGPGGLIQIGVWSLVVTGLYVWRRNLGPTVLMHILNDSFALVIAPLLLARFMR